MSEKIIALSIVCVFIIIVINIIYTKKPTGKNTAYKKQQKPSCRDIYISKRNGMYIFHGGCLGCKMQKKRGVRYCVNCKYFDANWDLPDLNKDRVREDLEIEFICKNKHNLY
jgi:NAD-dependent DNA ligase